MSSEGTSTKPNCRVYVSQYPDYYQENDLQDIFNRCGEVEKIEMKSFYSYVHFSDPKNAKDAIL